VTGQIPDIINRIDALKYKTWALLGKEPNTIYMSIAQYRQFCEETKDFWVIGADKINYGNGVLMSRSDHAPRPTQIMLMLIVKRAGEMECAFVPLSEMSGMIDAYSKMGDYRTCVHGNDFMACAKCIPPIAGKEFASNHDTIKISMVNTAPLAEARPRLAEWLRNQAIKDFENLQIKFEQRMPEIGESGIILFDKQAFFVTRTWQNYFHSYGKSGSTQIPIECAKDVVTLVRIE